MKHDADCELDWPVARWYGAGCRCARRAYARNPLPVDAKRDWTPAWAKGR